MKGMSHGTVINSIKKMEEYDKKFIFKAIQLNKTFLEQVDVIWDCGMNVFNESLIKKDSIYKLKRACATTLMDTMFCDKRTANRVFDMSSNDSGYEHELSKKIKEEYERVLFQD
jgi:hypothetical protein